MDADPMNMGPTIERLERAYPDVAADVLEKLPNLYERCAAHFGPALDVTGVIRRYTQASRIRFVGGGGAAGLFGCDELDAIVHAAEHGYELCLRRMGYDSYCWLPWSHDGECVKDNLFLWKLLFGQPASGVEVMDTDQARRRLSSQREYRFPGLGERHRPGSATPDPSVDYLDEGTEVREVVISAAGSAPVRVPEHGPVGVMTGSGRVVLCVDQDDVEVLHKPGGLRVEVIPWGELANDPDTDQGGLDLLEAAISEGHLDRALELARALGPQQEYGADEDPRAWLGGH